MLHFYFFVIIKITIFEYGTKQIEIMKETLRKRLEDEISRIDARCKQLLEHIQDYKDNNAFEEAMKNDIKHRQLTIVSQSLKKLLV